MAARRGVSGRREFGGNKREKLRAASQQIMAALEAGMYRVHGGGSTAVEIGDAVAKTVEGTVLYRPDHFFEAMRSSGGAVRVEVTGETTLQACSRLASCSGTGPVPCILNFASAKNPGGGFLKGSEAQEESVARRTTLYASLTCPTAAPYYAANRAHGSTEYTDHMIYSPNVLIVKDTDLQWLREPGFMGVVTCPAVNQSAKFAGDPDAIMARRMERVLRVMALHGHTSLVLGAFGCGVFKNHPAAVARQWHRLLSGPFRDVFETVVMAIPDETGPNHVAFRRMFPQDGPLEP